MNKVILIGNLGRDPELHYTQSGSSVANFTLATNEKFLKDGELQEHTEWHNIVVWGKQAEACNKYIKKGNHIAVDGKITYRSYEDKEGNKRYITEIIANRVEFLNRSTNNKNTTNDKGTTNTGDNPDFFNGELL